MAGVPFEIVHTRTGRGMFTFTATLNGIPVTSERYAPGDGDRRRNTAARWARDERLQNGRPFTEVEVARALEKVEHAAMCEADDGQGEDTEGVALEQASHVDEQQIAELAWNSASGSADFIVFQRDAQRIERRDVLKTYTGDVVPLRSARAGFVTPGGGIEGNVLLPTEAVKAGESETALRVDVRQFIDRYVELPGETVSVAVEYVLLTWVHDAFDELPYLCFRTPDLGRGKSRAIETVGAICYRPLFVGGGSSAAATLRMVDVFGGTLVADEFDQRRGSELGSQICQILNQGFQRNRPLVKCDGEQNEPRVFRCFGPKLFGLRKRLGDDATESRTISIVMQQRTRANIPLNLPRRQFDREALDLRNRLLCWRFVNLRRIKIDLKLADPRLEDRGNQIGLPLLSVANTAEVRERIVEALQEQQDAAAVERAESWEGEVFAACLAVGQAGGMVRPKDVVAEVNRRRADAAGVKVEKLPKRQCMTPQWCGKIMRRDLALSPYGRDNRGAWYSLNPVRVDQLRRRFGEGGPQESGVAPGQGHQRHNVTRHPEGHAKSGPLDSAKAESDVGDDSDVTGGCSGRSQPNITDDIIAPVQEESNEPTGDGFEEGVL